MVYTKSVIIFDLDGTLVDSAPDLIGTLNHILKSEGKAPLADALARPLVGHGAVALLQAGFREAGACYPEGEEADRLRDAFLDHYEGHLADRSAPYPGCVDCLEALKAQGFRLAVCTNKIERLALPLLDTLGLSAFFDEIVCRDSLPEYKPSPVPLLTIMERLACERGVMIGDTMTDVSAARAAGLPTLIANFGYGKFEEPLRESEQRFDHFEALPELIKTQYA